MMNLGYVISAVGPNIIEWLCLDKLLHRKNISTPVMLLFAIGSGIIITLQTQFAYNLILNSIVSVLAVFLFTFCYRESWIYRLFTSLSIYVIAVIAEGSSYLIARMFIPINMMQPNRASNFTLITICGVAIEAIYITIALCVIKSYKKRSHVMSIFILFLIVVLVYAMIFLIVTFADTAYLAPALILSALLIAAISGCLYLFTDQLRIQRERLQLANLEEMLENQVKHYSALYEVNRQVAEQRHNLKNILINVRSYIEIGEYDRLDKYVAGFQEKVQPSALIDNGMPFIDAVLSAKMAEHTEIPFEVDIKMLTLEHIKQPQIAFILACALDNAIEACEKSQNPFINVQIGQQGKMISIVILNAAEQPINAVGNTLLTTKEDKEAHGYGVKSMSQMAAQMHGMLTWSCEHQVFRLSVLLQDAAV